MARFVKCGVCVCVHVYTPAKTAQVFECGNGINPQGQGLRGARILLLQPISISARTRREAVSTTGHCPCYTIPYVDV